MKVQFDGVNKLIICETGTTSLDAKEDIYSAWKLWVTQEDNAKYLFAFSVLGGDPIGGGVYLGTTYFLENGWKIRPQESNHTLKISGNLYSRDGSAPVIKTIGNYNVLVDMSRSNLVDTVSTGGSDAPTVAEITQAIWNAMVSEYGTSGTMSGLIKQIEQKTDDILALEMIE